MSEIHDRRQQSQEPELTQQKRCTDLHVVTENGEQCFMWRANQLSYIAQDRQELPLVLANRFGPLATKLDLSYNCLSSFKNINLFSNLSELILDNNNLQGDHLDFKQNLRLKTLSLNKNKLLDLHRLVNSIKLNFPNLEFLSLIGNPLCPTLSSDSFSTSSEADSSHRLHPDGASLDQHSSCSNTSAVQDGHHLFDLCNSSSVLHPGTQQTEFSYQKYRYFIIYHLPNLRFLDSSPISGLERDEALRRSYLIKSRTMQDGEPTTQCSRHNNGNDNINNSLSTPPSVMADTNLAPPNSQEAGLQLTILTNHSDESNESCLQASQPSRGAFLRLSYKYTGKNSEGNRFIRNHDL